MPKADQIAELLDRGVDTIYPSRTALEKVLRSGKKIRLFLGVDPSGADLHVGHLVVLQKLRQFQQAGHEVILLLGDFTGQTGDPTDKTAARQPLTREQVLANAEHYQKQAARVLDLKGPNPTRLKYNSTWLDKLKFSDVAVLAGHFTVQQMLERDMFENRIKDGKPISLREFLYPLMQGYDSVAMDVDLEVGATDQTFNMLAGRKLQKEYNDKEKFVLATPLLVDTSGRKIGKTEGNAIAIAGDPNDLYGQVMTLPDEVIVDALEWCTSVPREEIKEVAALLRRHPRDAKMRLARAIVAEVNDQPTAVAAEAEFVKVFQERQVPDDLPVWSPSTRPLHTRDALQEAGLAASSSEAQRLLEQGAVKLDGEIFRVVGGWDPEPGSVLQVGKKRFVKVGK